MLRKEIQPKQEDVLMPLDRHERGVMAQRLKPDIWFSPKVIEVYKRVKRRVLYERPKSIPSKYG